jgi:hypothetical protein
LRGSSRLHEPIHLAAIDLLMGGLPALRHVLGLSGVRKRKRDDLRRGVGRPGIGVRRVALAIECQPIDARQSAEKVVERMVLHHHNDDVVKRHVRIDRAHWLVWKRPASGLPGSS